MCPVRQFPKKKGGVVASICGTFGYDKMMIVLYRDEDKNVGAADNAEFT